MDVACIEYIDVSSYFFDVEYDFSKYARYFDDEKDMQVLMNDVISKPRAIDKALQVFESERNQFTNLYVSEDSLECKEIRDYWGERIFPKIEDDVSGWLFLFDPIPFANWEHACKYLFVVNQECFELVVYNKGVCDAIQLEKIG